jgi:hypothetical protein
MFNLDDFHRSIHLTNNVLQMKFKNPSWINLLPDEKMWSLNEFLQFLKRRSGNDDDNDEAVDKLWNEKIYSSMKRNIIGTVLASLEGTTIRDRTFELNGADFLLGFDMEPILLEVNSSPNLAFTTAVKEEICSAIIRDLVNCKMIFFHRLLLLLLNNLLT